MHSDLDQVQRDNVMLDFKAGKTQVIIATDILSRGIDIDDIEMVVNYDVPHEPEDYVHRIGRTARANRDGRAVTFVAPDEAFRLRRIERLLEKSIPREEVPAEMGEAPVLENAKEKGKNNSRGRRGGSRHNGGRRHGKPSAKSKNNKSSNASADAAGNQSAVSSSNVKSSTSPAVSTK